MVSHKKIKAVLPEIQVKVFGEVPQAFVDRYAEACKAVRKIRPDLPQAVVPSAAGLLVRDGEGVGAFSVVGQDGVSQVQRKIGAGTLSGACVWVLTPEQWKMWKEFEERPIGELPGDEQLPPPDMSYVRQVLAGICYGAGPVGNLENVKGQLSRFLRAIVVVDQFIPGLSYEKLVSISEKLAEADVIRGMLTLAPGLPVSEVQKVEAVIPLLSASDNGLLLLIEEGKRPTEPQTPHCSSAICVGLASLR